MALTRKEISARYRERHREVVRERCRVWRAENPGAQAAACRDWEARNPDYHRVRRANDPRWKEKQSAANKRWRETRVEQDRARCRAYGKANAGAQNARCMKRHAAKLRATPEWLTSEHHQTMKMMYNAAARLTRSSGVSFNVDHIVPLQSKRVCGLHVPWNLQILRKIDNVRKGNRLEVS